MKNIEIVKQFLKENGNSLEGIDFTENPVGFDLHCSKSINYLILKHIEEITRTSIKGILPLYGNGESYGFTVRFDI